MIDSVDRIETMKASDLPHLFAVLVGNRRYPMAVEFRGLGRVYVRSLSADNEIIRFDHDEEVTVLIPDSLDNPATNMEMYLSLYNLGLMEEGN